MKKLNEKSTLSKDGLIVGLVFAGIAAFGLLIESGAVMFIAGLIAFLCFALFLSDASGHAVHVARQGVALSILPDLPPPISPVPGLFDPWAMPQVNREPPTMVNDLRSLFSNEKALSDHFGYLDGIQRQVADHLPRAIRRYDTDHSQLERQQIALYLMIHQASKQAAALEEAFPSLRAELDTVPQPPALPSTPKPSIITQAQYEKRASDMATATGQVLGRAAIAGSQGNTGLAILGVVAAVAGNVIQFQTMVRQMHDAHGQVKVFAARAAHDLDELGRSHAEIVRVSQAVYETSAHLRPLLVWVKDARRSERLSPAVTLDAEARAAIHSLKYYALMGRLQTARAV